MATALNSGMRRCLEPDVDLAQEQHQVDDGQPDGVQVRGGWKSVVWGGIRGLGPAIAPCTLAPTLAPVAS